MWTINHDDDDEEKVINVKICPNVIFVSVEKQVKNRAQFFPTGMPTVCWKSCPISLTRSP